MGIACGLDAAVTVVLAIALLGDRPSSGETLAIVVAMLGVLVAARAGELDLPDRSAGLLGTIAV